MALQEVSIGSPDGATFGRDASALIGFWGATPAARRTGSFTTVTTSAATSTTPFGFSTSTQANAIVTTLNEVVAVLVAAGLRGTT